MFASTTKGVDTQGRKLKRKMLCKEVLLKMAGSYDEGSFRDTQEDAMQELTQPARVIDTKSSTLSD
jgi:hypothetical protein